MFAASARPATLPPALAGNPLLGPCPLPATLSASSSAPFDLYDAATRPAPATWYEMARVPDPGETPLQAELREANQTVLDGLAMLVDLHMAPLPPLELDLPVPVPLPSPGVETVPAPPPDIPRAARAYASPAPVAEVCPPPAEPLHSTRETLAQAADALGWKSVALAPEPPLFTRKELAAGIAFALVTASLGFTLTRGHLAGLHLHLRPLDRRAAEAPSGGGDDRPGRFHAPAAGQPLTYIPYAGPPPPALTGEDVAFNAPDASASPQEATPTATGAATATPPPLPSRPAAPPTPQVTPVATPTPPPAAPPSHPRSLWPDGPSPRRPDGPVDSAWSVVAPSLARIQTGNDAYVSGVVVDGSGIVATRWSALPGSPQVQVSVNGQTVTGSVLGGVDGVDLALIQLPGGSWPAAPLCPEPPVQDEVLGYLPGPGGPTSGLQHARVIGAVPEGSGLLSFMGAVGSGDAGNILVNGRGELAAIVLGKPASFPGCSTCLAADMSSLWQVLQARTAGTLSAHETDANLLNTQFRAMLGTELGSPAGPGQGTDVIPGASVGMYRLGMSLSDLQRALGTITDPTPGADPGWDVLHDPVSQTDFYLADGRVVAMRTTNPVFTTRLGVGVGALTVNIDLSHDRRYTSGQWGNGESYIIRPGLELWAGSDGRVRRLLVEPAQTSTLGLTP